MRPILFLLALHCCYKTGKPKKQKPHEVQPSEAKKQAKQSTTRSETSKAKKQAKQSTTRSETSEAKKQAKQSTTRSETSEAKKRAKQSLNAPKPHQRRKTQRLASWILREEISRNGALRRGDCLSEASLSPFSGMQTDFSKIRAALNFCFFWVKPKEKKK